MTSFHPPIQIAYDHRIFSLQQYGGVSRYFVEIAKRIHGFDGFDVEILCPLYVNRYLKEAPSSGIWGWRWPKLPKSGRVTLGFNGALVRWKLSRQPPALIHETYYAKTRLASGRTKTVITIHDMIYEKFPQYFSQGDVTHELKRASVERADHIVCVSETTRTDLVNILGVRPEQTSVIYLGPSMLSRDGGSFASPTERPYIAYVGPRGQYKNFSGVLRAFSHSDFLRKNLSIVCFGGGPLTKSEREAIARSGLYAGQVLQISGSDSALSQVYRGAQAFVYPSLYEGFGLPPLEAMSVGCPVIAANKGSIPEVCGTAAEYFDPYVPESMAQAMESVVCSESRKQDLVQQGYRQIENYSWDRCARETAAVYRTVVS